MTQDEIVVTMTASDWNLLMGILLYGPQTKARKELVNRLSRSCETLTLEWLDRKREEFP